DVVVEELERGGDLHDRRGVGDVLRGGAPVAPFTETVGAKLDDLLHDAQDRIADSLSLLLQAGEVDVFDPALTHDFARGLFGNDAEARLRAGERGLEIETIGGPRLVGKKTPQLRSAEDVGEKEGNERRRGHAFSPAVSANEYSIRRPCVREQDRRDARAPPRHA